MHGLHQVCRIRFFYAVKENSLTVVLLTQDTSWTSDNPKTGWVCKSHSPHASWATAPWQKCYMETQSLSGKETTTGTGSRTMLRMITCKL